MADRSAFPGPPELAAEDEMVTDAVAQRPEAPAARKGLRRI